MGTRGRGDVKKVPASPADALVELMLLPMTAAKSCRGGERAIFPPARVLKALALCSETNCVVLERGLGQVLQV